MEINLKEKIYINIKINKKNIKKRSYCHGKYLKKY